MTMDTFTMCRVQRTIDGYIHAKVPAPMRTSVQLVYDMDDHSLTLHEKLPGTERHQWKSTPVARFTLEHGYWHVHAFQPQAQQWKPVDHIAPTSDFEQQLQKVEEDEHQQFWPEWAEEEWDETGAVRP
ncbi:DUF3024 domain-containing protein [Paenibacillus kandeliae]|uniref:DUF3024 domain-containing protein n=1 Tax=Paenibacillus kandeliae TaxID=3231269 RepID=UPI00345A6605